jgi:hypothetical protein
MNNSAQNSNENNAAHIPGKINDIAHLILDAILPYADDIDNIYDKKEKLNDKSDDFFDVLEPYIVDNEEFPQRFEDMNMNKYEEIKRHLGEIIDIIHNKPKNEREDYVDMLIRKTREYISEIINAHMYHENNENNNNNNVSQGGRRKGRGRTHHKKHKTRKARRAHKKRHTRRHKRSTKRRRTIRRKN